MNVYAYTKEEAEAIQAKHPGAGFTVYENKFLLPADYVDENAIPKGVPFDYPDVPQSPIKK